MSFLDTLLGQESQQQLGQRPLPSASDMLMAPSQPRQVQERGGRGLFGLHGTARDIVGALGDIILMGGGDNPIYRPIREQEEVSQRMSGFSQDPLGAIDRLAQVNPSLAQKYWKEYQDGEQQRQAAQVSQQQLADRARTTVGAMLRAAKGRPDAYKQSYDQAVSYANRYGLSTDDIPKTFDPSAIDLYAQGTVPVDKQIDNENNAERNRIYKQQALSNISNTAYDNSISAFNAGTSRANALSTAGSRAASLGTAARNSGIAAYKADHPTGKGGGRRTGGAAAPSAAIGIPAFLGDVPAGKGITGPGGVKYVSLGNGQMRKQ